MGPVTNLVGVIVALFGVSNDAAMTDAREESCTDLPVKQQLVQARAILHHQEDEADNGPHHGVTNGPPPLNSRPAAPAAAGLTAAQIANQEAEDSQKCFCHDEYKYSQPSKAKCADGNFSSDCEKHGHGPVVECPCRFPNRCFCASGNCCRWQWGSCGSSGLACKGERRPTPKPTALPNLFRFSGDDPQKAKDGELKMCQGDCDTDEHCKGNLKCFERDGYTSIPGCDGLGDEKFDYCYDPDALGLPHLQKLSDHPTVKLSLCWGDCDSDNECRDGLVCYHRDDTSTVPGCAGVGTTNTDYCIEPFTELHDKGINPSVTLEECAGDCDNDSQCVGALKCFQRPGLEEVPGCSGPGFTNWDYCFDPAKK